MLCNKEIKKVEVERGGKEQEGKEKLPGGRWPCRIAMIWPNPNVKVEIPKIMARISLRESAVDKG
jgi:hypothetical protein